MSIGCLVVIFAAVACGGGNGEKGTVAEPGATPAAAKGAAYDCEYFTMTVASGWEASPENMGMVNILPKGQSSPGLYFKFEGKGNAVGTAEASIESMITRYEGSPMESTTVGGVEFKTTTYVYGGSAQTMHVAFREGTKITITIEGRDGKDNPDIQAMLGSVSFK